VAAALVAVACGTDDDEGAAPVTTLDTAPAPAGDAPVVAPPGATDPGAPPASAPSGTPGEPAPPGVEPPPTDEPPPPGAEAPIGAVGEGAGWYLQADGAASILVEVRSQAGAEPRSAAIERVQAVLADLTGKPVEISAAAVPGSARTWTADEVRALADGGAAASPARGVLRLLFLRGGFAESERAVGVAVRSDVAAVFADRVDEAAGVFGDRAAVEEAVTMHEVGHLLGLVDLVLATGRADPEHPGHSPNRGSVMYYAVESTLLGTVLSGGPPRDFDADDLADLASIRDA